MRLHPQSLRPAGHVLLNDETLRDGLQSPSVRDPLIQDKIDILHLMEALGINSLNLGLPGAGPRAVEHVTALAREIVNHKMKIRANCAARTHENDIRPIAEIMQRTGLPIEAATFIGSSPIRRYTEGWTEDFLLQTTEKAIKFAVSLGLAPMYVTEDTTRCDPEMVKKLYSTAISNGARAIVICDTAGHATPMGAFALVRFVIDEVVKPSGEKIRVDWHGHCDRGLGVPNAMAAWSPGAECVHASALGVGERVGNTQMDQMLVNLKLMGIAPWASRISPSSRTIASPCRGPQAFRFPQIIPWSAKTHFARRPAFTPRRSSRPSRRTTSNSPTPSTPACPPMCSDWNKSSTSAP